MAPGGSGPSVTEGAFTNVRRQQLFTLTVLPPEGAAKAVLVWAHGHFEHCRRKQKGA
jgi:alpha-beta hydrolase superfamily lysophospholipase